VTADGQAALVPLRALAPVHVQLVRRTGAMLAEGDLHEACAAGRAAAALARLAGDSPTATTASLLLGHALLAMGALDEAAELATRVLTELGGAAEPSARARALALRASAEVDLGHVLAALDDLAAALAVVEGQDCRTASESAAGLAVAAVLMRLSLFELALDLLARTARRDMPGSGTYRLLAVRSLLSVHLVWGARLELLGEEREAEEHFASAASWSLLLARLARATGRGRIARAAVAAEAYAVERLGSPGLGAARARAALAAEEHPDRIVEWLPGRLAMASAAWAAGDEKLLGSLVVAVERHGAASPGATGRDLWEGLARPELARLAAPLPGGGAAEPAGGHAAVPFLREIAVAAARRMWQEREARAADLRQRILRTELTRRGERTARELQVDALTGLGNRRRLEIELATGRHQGVLFIDLDHFKQVNDTFGHAVGDEVLRRIAAVLRQCCRDGDVPVRYGGDEFVVLLGGDPDGDGGASAARRLGARVLERVRATDWSDLVGSLPVSVSVGAARGEAAGALRRSDAAMLAAKRAGRDTLVGA
jgi:diguanylate cyclase